MHIKTIALFGGSGKTGLQFLPLALKAWFKVQALVRTPSKIGFADPALTVIQGDVLDPAAVKRTVAGADVVVSVFGHVKGSPEWVQTDGTRHILQAMDQAGVKKIISLSGGGLPFEKDKPGFPDHLIRTIMKVAVPKVLNDAVKHAELLAASDKDWTIVRGPRLTDDPAKGTYRVGWVGVNASTQISRADLADFLLRQVSSDEFIRQMPFVCW